MQRDLAETHESQSPISKYSGLHNFNWMRARGNCICTRNSFISFFRLNAVSWDGAGLAAKHWSGPCGVCGGSSCEDGGRRFRESDSRDIEQDDFPGKALKYGPETDPEPWGFRFKPTHYKCVLLRAPNRAVFFAFAQTVCPRRRARREQQCAN